MDSYDSRIRTIAGLIKEAAPKVFALTGAGISTESGIPDFRSPGSGLWEKVDPMAELSVSAMQRNPQRFYTFGISQFTKFKDAQPNQGHRVLAWMEEAGYLAGVITQNIDSLHQAAGSQNVMELHGNMRTCRCLDCGGEFPYNLVDQNIAKGIIPPQCKCGGIIRPNVVLFGDSMPMDYILAMRAVQSCDLLLVVAKAATSKIPDIATLIYTLKILRAKKRQIIEPLLTLPQTPPH